MTRREILAMAALPAYPFGGSVQPAEKRLFELINDDRRRAEFNDLLWVDALADVARAHSARMMELGYFSHVDPELGDSAARMTAAGIRWSRCSENIFHCKGWEDPLRLADICWMTSPGHRANILQDTAGLSGIGISRKTPDDWFITQVFIAPR